MYLSKHVFMTVLQNKPPLPFRLTQNISKIIILWRQDLIMGEKKMFKYDVHVHTSETSSCGKVPAVQVVRMYKDAGYKGIIITDHYYDGYFDNIEFISWEAKMNMWLKGYKIAKSKGDEIGLTVILGMEVRFYNSPNDYLVYGTDETLLKNNPELYMLGLEKFKTFAEDNRLLIYQAHPYRPNITAAPPKLLDGVEVYNGNPRHNSHNDSALEFAIDNNLKMLSGSDFHQIEDIARGGLMLKQRINTVSELLGVLKAQAYELIKNV